MIVGHANALVDDRACTRQANHVRIRCANNLEVCMNRRLDRFIVGTLKRGQLGEARFLVVTQRESGIGAADVAD